MLNQIGATDRYKRAPGIDGAVAAKTHQTSLDPGNLGCWLSHLEILESHADGADYLHIAEDDSVFPAEIIQMIEGAIGAADSSGLNWDLMFTEVFKSIELYSF